jgi:hypothetical protein
LYESAYSVKEKSTTLRRKYQPLQMQLAVKERYNIGMGAPGYIKVLEERLAGKGD